MEQFPKARGGDAIVERVQEVTEAKERGTANLAVSLRGRAMISKFAHFLLDADSVNDIGKGRQYFDSGQGRSERSSRNDFATNPIENSSRNERDERIDDEREIILQLRGLFGEDDSSSRVGSFKRSKLPINGQVDWSLSRQNRNLRPR